MNGIGQPGRAIQSASIELIRNVCHAHGSPPPAKRSSPF